MIEIEIEWLGAIRRPWPEQQKRLSVPEESTISDLLTRFQFKDDERRFIVSQVNGMRAKETTRVQAEDRVTFMLIVGGG